MLAEGNSYSAGDRMVEAAIRLFSQFGVQNTGVDQIIGESCSARGTLYKQFGSKSGLIAAALDVEGQQWREWFFSEIAAKADEPRDQLLAIFDVLAAWFRRENYSGCLFMNAVAECRNHDPVIRDATIRHKKEVNRRLRKIARDAGASQPAKLIQQIDLLIDGLIITALVTRSAKAVRNGKAAAESLLEIALDH